MRLDLVVVFLAKRFIFRSYAFFHHWYWHTFLFFREWARAVKKYPMVYEIAVFFLVLMYIIWACIPLYLFIRIFYVYDFNL